MLPLDAACTLYPATAHPTSKQKLRVVNRAAIYGLIAGTYTPLAIGVLYTGGCVFYFAVRWYSWPANR